MIWNIKTRLATLIWLTPELIFLCGKKTTSADFQPTYKPSYRSILMWSGVVIKAIESTYIKLVLINSIFSSPVQLHGHNI